MSWSTGGDINTARYVHASAGAGITDGIIMCGFTTAQIDSSEEYNGTSWSSGGTTSTAIGETSGFGSQSDAVVCGGSTSGDGFDDITEEYNGTSFSSGGNLATGIKLHKALGDTITDGLKVGGNDGTYNNKTEEYNGTSWSAGGNYTSANISLGAGGIPTDAVGVNGRESAEQWSNDSNEYNGTSWAAGNDSGRSLRDPVVGATDSSSAFSMSGVISTGVSQITTEDYDGTSWSAGTSMSTGRTGAGSNPGTSSNTFVSGGYSSTLTTYIASVEEWYVAPAGFAYSQAVIIA